MNREADCTLSILFPRSIEEQLTDFMLAHEALTSGFVSVPVQGHGVNAVFATAGEKVRGTARQLLLTAIMNEREAQVLLADLKAELPGANIVYWLTPLKAFGSLV